MRETHRASIRCRWRAEMAVRLFRILYWASFVFGIFMTAGANLEMARVGRWEILFLAVIMPVMFTPHLLVVVANYLFRAQWVFFPWQVR